MCIVSTSILSYIEDVWYFSTDLIHLLTILYWAYLLLKQYNYWNTTERLLSVDIQVGVTLESSSLHGSTKPGAVRAPFLRFRFRPYAAMKEPKGYLSEATTRRFLLS